MRDNSTLKRAKKAKNDEFYTRMSDIDAELVHYYDFLRGKSVICPCDSPESNFTKYLIQHFSEIGLKKLVCTCYNKEGLGKKYIVESGYAELGFLEGNGDFRSEEVKSLIDEADVVITNPPFSISRALISILIEKKKKFLLIGTINWLCCGEFAVEWIENRVWPGFLWNKNLTFNTPDGEKRIGIAWWTNIDAGQKINPLVLTKTYTGNESKYPKYDNCDAIEVSWTADIPKDYFDIMGVPVSAAGKICREQFDVLGTICRGVPPKYEHRTKIYTKEEKNAHKNGNDLNGGPVLVENGNYRVVYTRILIKRKT